MPPTAQGCPTTSVANYENCGAPVQGLYSYPGPNAASSIDTQYAIVASRNLPNILNATNIKNWKVICEASLRARGIIYWKTGGRPCPSPSGVPGIGSGQIVGLSGQAASGVVGGLGAAGVLAGPATFGISTAVSLAVSAITGIFTHHAQAVANEQATICSVAMYFNPLMKQIDDAVASGQISDQEGIAYIRQVGNQAINGLQSILQTCNAACWYIGIIKAHMDFVGVFYPILSPISMFTANRPGQSPLTINSPGASIDAGGTAPLRSTNDPGFAYAPGIVSAGPSLVQNSRLPSGCTICPDYLNQGYNQQTGQSGQAADVPPTGINWTMWGAIAAIILLILVVFK